MINPSFMQLDKIFGNVVSELNNMGISFNDHIVDRISKDIELLSNS